MATQFKVDLPTGEFLLGRLWKAAKPTKNLVIEPGMDEHSLRYEDMALFLNGKGVSVYVLDTFGQGLNAKDESELQKWPHDAFAKTVDALDILIKKAKAETKLPTALYGHSMGSFMVQSYLERYPLGADRVIICGSNGPCKGKMALAYGLSKVIVHKKNWDKPSHVLQNAGLGAYAKAIKNSETDFDWLSYNKDNVKKYIDDPYCGHVNTNGFWREFLKGMNALYRPSNLKKLNRDERILILFGRDDPVGGCGDGVKKLDEMYRSHGIKDVTVIGYENMRHEIHNELNHQQVYDDIAEFLTAKN